MVDGTVLGRLKFFVGGENIGWQTKHLLADKTSIGQTKPLLADKTSVEQTKPLLADKTSVGQTKHLWWTKHLLLQKKASVG